MIIKGTKRDLVHRMELLKVQLKENILQFSVPQIGKGTQY